MVDGVVVEEFGLEVDESLLTDEADPTAKLGCPSNLFAGHQRKYREPPAAAAEHFGIWRTDISRLERRLKRDNARASINRTWLNTRLIDRLTLHTIGSITVTMNSFV